MADHRTKCISGLPEEELFVISLTISSSYIVDYREPPVDIGDIRTSLIHISVIHELACGRH